MVMPHLKPAFLAESRRQIVITARSIKIMLHLVLTSPEYLDWAFDLLRDRGRLNHVVIGKPSAKTAATSNHVNRDVVGVDVEQLCHARAAWPRILRGSPDFDFPVLIGGYTVLRFHGGVRYEWVRIGGVYQLCRLFQRAVR